MIPGLHRNVMHVQGTDSNFEEKEEGPVFISFEKGAVPHVLFYSMVRGYLTLGLIIFSMHAAAGSKSTKGHR